MQMISEEAGESKCGGDLSRDANQNVSPEILMNLSFVEREKLVKIKQELS